MRKNPLLIYSFLLLLAIIATYSNHFYNGFHFDDEHSIVENTNIRTLKNIPVFFKDGSTSSVLPQNQSYRPVTETSLAFDYWLGNGYNMFYFHLSTFILFLVQGLLMLLLFNKLLGSASTNKKFGFVALFAVAWYMLHPATAETVNYVIARADVQSTVAVVAALVLYIYSPFCRKTYIYLIPVGIGALAKPPSVMFAPILFFYILFFEENISLADIFKKAHLKKVWISIRKSIPAFIFCALMYVWIDRLTPKTWQAGGNSPIKYLITQPYVILHYFGTFFWPTGLSADSDWVPLASIKDARFFIGCTFILAMLVAAFYTSKTALLRPISFGILWFFIALVPTSSIIPLAEVLNDHRMFFPFVGLALSVSWTIGLIVLKLTEGLDFTELKHKALILVPVLILLGTCAYGTYKRNEVWHSEESLWRNVTLKSPKNGRGLMNYGIIKVGDGKYAEAEAYFNRALQLLPSYSFIYVNMGVLKEKTGDIVNAENYYLNGIELGSIYPSHFFLYGEFLYHQARFIEAELMLQKSIALSNSYLGPRLTLMKTYELLGQWDDLKILALSTLNIAPDNADALTALDHAKKRKTKSDIDADDIKSAPTAEKYLTLSNDYYQEGKYQQCIIAAEQAIMLKPNYADAYNNLGCAYTMLEQYDRAADALQKALSINPGYELAKNNLILTKAHRNISGDAITGKRSTADDYLNQSLLYYNQRQYDLCIAACLSALQLKPDYDLPYNNLCAAYNNLGEWDQAIETANKGLKINPNNERIKSNLAESIKGKKLNQKK